MKKFLLALVIIGMIALITGWLFVRNATQKALGDAPTAMDINIPAGAGVSAVATLLEQKGVVKYAWAFKLYMRQSESGTIKAGTYNIPPYLNVPDVVTLLVAGRTIKRDIAVTFPEGWTLGQIADRLTEEGFNGDGFKEIVTRPSEDLRERFDFLTSVPSGQSLEGYLFPDTYNFLPEATSRDIAETMLAHFGIKFSQEMRDHITRYGQSVHEIVTLASIIEREVHIDEERGIVSGIFYNRLRQDITLGSDATLDYIFGESKIKHTLEDTKVDSPYNTYKNLGLPPGPISNPGIGSLRAAVYPEETEYLFFLNNVKTGKTVFSKTFQEHVNNKGRNGL